MIAERLNEWAERLYGRTVRLVRNTLMDYTTLWEIHMNAKAKVKLPETPEEVRHWWVEQQLKVIVPIVYRMLQDRILHPCGTFENGGKFYLADSELVHVKAPTHAWPFSQMTAGRTKKFVMAVAKKYGCVTVDELVSHFHKADRHSAMSNVWQASGEVPY